MKWEIVAFRASTSVPFSRGVMEYIIILLGKLSCVEAHVPGENKTKRICKRLECRVKCLNVQLHRGSRQLKGLQACPSVYLGFWFFTLLNNAVQSSSQQSMDWSLVCCCTKVSNSYGFKNRSFLSQ